VVNNDQGRWRVSDGTANAHQNPAPVVHPNSESLVPPFAHGETGSSRPHARRNRVSRRENAQSDESPLAKERDDRRRLAHRYIDPHDDILDLPRFRGQFIVFALGLWSYLLNLTPRCSQTPQAAEAPAFGFGLNAGAHARS
jgi:hypothetical protein